MAFASSRWSACRLRPAAGQADAPVAESPHERMAWRRTARCRPGGTAAAAAARSSRSGVRRWWARTRARAPLEPTRRRGGAWQGCGQCCWRHAQRVPGVRNGAPEGRFGVQQGYPETTWSRGGACRAVASASFTPHRQDVGPGGAAAAASGAVEPVRDAPVWAWDASGAPLGNGGAVATGRQQVASVTPIPAWRLDARQFTKIKRANRLQLVAKRGLLERIGQVVEPPLILPLEVEQGAHRILPALRSRAPVVRPAVLRARLLRLAPRSIAPLAFGVRQRHGHCTPLRNGPDPAPATLHPRCAACSPRSRSLPTAGSWCRRRGALAAITGMPRCTADRSEFKARHRRGGGVELAFATQPLPACRGGQRRAGPVRHSLALLSVAPPHR